MSYVYNGEKLFIPRHVTFERPKVIAGANSQTPLKVVEKLIEQHGGSAEGWQKKVAKITSDKYIFDVHWYELDGVQYGMKMKHRSERRQNR